VFEAPWQFWGLMLPNAYYVRREDGWHLLNQQCCNALTCCDLDATRQRQSGEHPDTWLYEPDAIYHVCFDEQLGTIKDRYMSLHNYSMEVGLPEEGEAPRRPGYYLRQGQIIG